MNPANASGWFLARRVGKPFALAIAVLCCLMGAVANAAPLANRYNEALLRLSPQERAAKLAEHLGLWCIGTNPFYMGITKDGPAAGYAYWSLQCAGRDSYAIQIDPEGHGVVTDCRTLKEQGDGRECYKTF
jgi:hypothetical protein